MSFHQVERAGNKFLPARRNEPQWREIAQFLDSIEQRCIAGGARGERSVAAAARAAGVCSIPVGNHGDNLR